LKLRGSLNWLRKFYGYQAIVFLFSEETFEVLPTYRLSEFESMCANDVHFWRRQFPMYVGTIMKLGEKTSGTDLLKGQSHEVINFFLSLLSTQSGPESRVITFILSLLFLTHFSALKVSFNNSIN
jgi:hypothetical protein